MEGASTRRFKPRFEFRCNVQWNDMQATDASGQVKRCDPCKRTVHLCVTETEFEQHARQGSCVAVYEDGLFAHRGEKPFDPVAGDPGKPGAPDGGPPLPPDRPWKVRVPTAGVPRHPERHPPAPHRPASVDPE